MKALNAVSFHMMSNISSSGNNDVRRVSHQHAHVASSTRHAIDQSSTQPTQDEVDQREGEPVFTPLDHPHDDKWTEYTNLSPRHHHRRRLNPCYHNPCLNHGRCHFSNEGGYKCQCRKGFSGDICDRKYSFAVAIMKLKEATISLSSFSFVQCYFRETSCI